MKTRTELSPRDRRAFERLVLQESHSIKGQAEKMTLIEDMIRDRHDDRRLEMENDLANSRISGDQLTRTVEVLVQPIRISHMPLGDGRFVLLVEKGDLSSDELAEKPYTILLYSHIDTVAPGARTELRDDPEHPGRLKGLGVYDMLGPALNNVALISEVEVPKGVRLIAAFFPDEEEDSRGTLMFTKQWDQWPEVDCILSSEIGPLDSEDIPEGAVPLILARSGRVKFDGSISVNQNSQGHGADGDVLNATTLKKKFLGELKRRFKGKKRREDYVPARREHPLLGTETIEDGKERSWSSREGYNAPNMAEFQFSARLVPPSSVQDVEQKFKQWAKNYIKAAGWEGKVSSTFVLNDEETSYDPYEMPKNHRLVEITREVVKRVAGVEPMIVGAPSVADECVFAKEMLAAAKVHSFSETEKGIINIPVRGDGAHNVDEWIDQSDLLRVREIFRALIEALIQSRESSNTK